MGTESKEVVNVPSMIADAFEAAARLGEQRALTHFQPAFTKVAESELEVTYLQRLEPAGAGEFISFDRARRDIHVRLDSLGSLVDFLSSPPKAFAELGAPVVTIEPEEAEITYAGHAPFRVPLRRLQETLESPDAAYRSANPLARTVRMLPAQVRAVYNADGHEQRHTVTMPLAYAEAYRALLQIFDGVKQKRLWTLLATDLQGCFPEQYEMCVSQISLLEKNSQDVDIARSGVTNVTASRTLELTFRTQTGDRSSEIEIDWTYKGPLWTCFDLAIEIPCRLVISKDGMSLVFELFPRGLEALLLAHRAALATELTTNLVGGAATIPVYEGRL